MLKKSQLKKSTSLIVSLLFLFMLTATIMIPLFVNGKEAISNTNFVANDDDDEIDDDDEEENERSVTVDVDGTYAEIYSESETEIGEFESENSFQVTIDASSGSDLSIELEYEAEIEVGETESEVELEYEISFLQLIGYNDADADNIYDPAIDTAVETYNIGGFSNIQYTYDADPDGDLHILIANTTDGKFGIIAYITNRFVMVDDILITPTEIKFDIYINDFVGAFERVALKTDLEFEGESEYETETDDEELGFTEEEVEIALSFNAYKGFFSWKEVATTDGVEHPVYYTPFDPVDVEQIIYLNYVAGNKIIHDPKVGVSGILIGYQLGLGFGLFFPELSRSGFLIASAAVALIAVSGSLIALRRKKK